jgi:hypothetical protein
MGTQTGYEIWNTPPSVDYIVANLGISAETFRKEPSAGSLAKMLREHGVEVDAGSQTVVTS